MRNVYFSSGNIISSLGFSTEENAAAMLSGQVGIKIYDDPGLYPGPVPASRVDNHRLDEAFQNIRSGNSRLRAANGPCSRLEKMLFCSITAALENTTVDPSDPRTLLIFSTTKGNIDLLGSGSANDAGRRLHLWELAGFIAQLFDCFNRPVIISNACISGSVAMITAARMIASGQYDHAIVTGGDIVSEFVVSGFMSFQALSPDPCRPFDANRTGLSIGEGCGTVIMSANPEVANGQKPVRYLGGAVSNDANHISGPSRDGEGLYLSIAAAMQEAGVSPADIDFISAHGTATPYNDEMESLALAWAG
jgi:3-oxoacyl-[acyl-carrier-protein] synthase I